MPVVQLLSDLQLRDDLWRDRKPPAQSHMASKCAGLEPSLPDRDLELCDVDLQQSLASSLHC
jgi:hypothetical protein